MLTATFSGPSIPDANVIVVVFAMKGCEHCEEYVPRFQKIAAAYKAKFPVLILDAATKDAETQRFATQIGVGPVPVTAVLRRGPGIYKVVGSVTDAEIRQILDLASRFA